MSEARRRLKQRFAKAIRPMFTSDDHNQADLIGTCTLVRIHDKPFVLSATHVFDCVRNGPIYIQNHGRFLQLIGEEVIRSNGKPDSTLSEDPFDVTFIALSESGIRNSFLTIV